MAAAAEAANVKATVGEIEGSVDGGEHQSEPDEEVEEQQRNREPAHLHIDQGSLSLSDPGKMKHLILCQSKRDSLHISQISHFLVYLFGY